MTLKYIIAVDFEATQPGRMEVIEFPAILMDITNGAILSEFHKYVKPTENSTISQLCFNLTGMKQSTIDDADELPIVLRSFDVWLKGVISKYGLVLPNWERGINVGQINCGFVTWGDYDFKNMLIPECHHKGYQVPSYFLQWFDLRTTFNSKFNRGDISFENALNQAGVPLKGRLHCGIDDARNLANLSRKLYVSGTRITTLSKN